MRRAGLPLLLSGCLLGPAEREAFEDRDGDGSPWTEDCDDADPERHPGAEEVCRNGIDDDCSGDAGDCALTGGLFVETAATAGILGEDDDERVGLVVAGVGDLDGDGVPEWVAGGSRLVLGHGVPDGTIGIEAGEIVVTAARIGGVDGWDDVDGDGVDELVVGAPVASGEVALISTVSRAKLVSLVGPADAELGSAVASLRAASRLAVAGVDGSDALVWLVDPETAIDLDGAASVLRIPDRDALVPALSAADVDGDGVEELLLGAPSQNAVYVIPHDAAGATAAEDAAVAVLSGESALDQAGAAVAIAGDVDGDGLPDVLVGAPQRSGTVGNGVAYLVQGRVDGEIGLQTAATVFLGAAEGDGAGWSVAGLGDMDGAGVPDVAIGAPYAAGTAAESTGIAYVVYDPPSGTVNLADADLALYGGIAHEAGRSVAGPGDLDGDGYADLLVGAPLADPGEPPVANGGAAWIVLGSGL